MNKKVSSLLTLGIAVVALLMLFALTLSFAQETPKPKPKPKSAVSDTPASPKKTAPTRPAPAKTAKPAEPASESKPVPEKVVSNPTPNGPTVLLRPDADCRVKIDGKLVGSFTAGEARQLSVGLGQRLIEADTSDGKFHWEQILEIKNAGQVIVSTNLRGEMAKAEEAERQAAAAIARTEQETRERQAAAEALERAKRIEFVRIPAGSFVMGSANGESDEKPEHRVAISRSFELGKYEVTQAQWEAVMGSNPSNFKGDARLPVENISWEDAQQFISTLNSRSDGYIYRLPSEAEWEYAARAGTTGDYAGNLYEIAWYADNSWNKTHPVGEKKPNGWGLYDMHGNVWECVQDWYASYGSESLTDPLGPSSGSVRVARGGGWGNAAAGCRSAFRFNRSPGGRGYSLGFRLLRTPK